MNCCSDLQTENDVLRAQVRLLEGRIQRLMIAVIDVENTLASLRQRDQALDRLLRDEAAAIDEDNKALMQQWFYKEEI